MYLHSRIILLMRRAKNAYQLGVRFSGTTSFQMPKTVSINGGEISISCPDDEALKYDFINIWLDDEYSLSTVSAPRTVVDIGSNIGLFSLWARMVFGDFSVHAYEPNAALHSHLSRNLSAFPDFDLYTEAVGSCEGFVKLTPGESSRLSRVVSESRDIKGTIPMVSLSTVVARAGGAVDLLKMDCEGGEWDILTEKGALSCVKYIVMEYHLFDGRKFTELEALARKAGFKVHHHNERNCIVHLANTAK